MGCVALPQGMIPVSDAVALERRNVCRECVQATRNKKRLDRTTKGLTCKSVCRVLREREPTKPGNIKVGTMMPRARCPLGKWPAVPG